MNTSCPMRERFLEANSQRTERKRPGPGRPGTVDGLVAGGALGGAAPSLGRARCLAARGGFTTRLQGCLASTLAPPTAPSRQRGLLVEEFPAKLGRSAPREREAWLFENWITT